MKGTSVNPSNMIVTHRDPSASASEAFRILRTNLQFMSIDNPIRSLVVTSATPGEGKTTMTANLAVAFAQTGARVCLVDADLRRSMVAKLFGVDNWSGLTTTLIGQGDLDMVLQETKIPGLTLLPSGPIPPNPAEMLGSARMSNLLTSLQDRFDIVLVDTPPVLAVTDAAVVAPKVDGVVLVVRSGAVPREQAIRAKVALEAVKANLLGVILAGLKSDDQDGYYYNYYQSEDAKKSRR